MLSHDASGGWKLWAGRCRQRKAAGPLARSADAGLHLQAASWIGLQGFTHTASWLSGSSLRAKAAELVGRGLCTAPQVGAHREGLLLASHLAIGVEQDGAAALVFMQ